MEIMYHAWRRLGKVAEIAEGDVDYAAGAAGATFDRDWEGELVGVELG